MTDVVTALGAGLADRYRIERELGQGGMATVYLAHDLKHDRDVAIKVLHPELGAALGGERFLSEIRTTAKLQHPHILPLLDSGAAEGLLYYVMPYVTGDTLRDRLVREKQLPIEDAVRIAREVADALGAAHVHGIIHRDIKPENILLQGGHAVVADFGIALAVEHAGGQRMTQTGLSLGTPQYMSPEQAMGDKSIDARSDIYALGAVTYEMLAGEAPFTGPSAQAIVAKVMTEAPVPPTRRRGTIPPHVEDAVLTALEKLPADRFATAVDFAAALTHGAPLSLRRGRGHTVRSAPRTALFAFGAIALMMTTVAAWSLLLRSPASRRPGNGPTYETAIVLPDSTPLAYIGAGPLGVGTPAFAVSPDGGTLVFVGQSPGTTHLYVRPLDASSVSVLPGTEGAYAPFFSPDGQSVGFFAGGTVKRTNIKGGATVALAELVLPYGAAWLADGRILILAEEGRSLVAVPSAGGTPNAIGPQPLPLRVVFPEPLPGDSAVLASTIDSHLAVVSTTSGRIELLGPRGPIPLDSVTEKTELFSGTNPRYVASGHLLYHSLDGAVMALPFDPISRRALGPPVPALSGVRLESIWGAGQLAVTRDGTLIYARGENGRQNRLVWRDDRGHVDTLAAFGRGDYGYMDLSRDGTRLLVRVCTSQGTCAPHLLSLREGVQVSLRADLSSSSRARSLGWWDRERVFDYLVRRPEAPSVQATIVYSPESPARSDSLPGVRVLDVATDSAVLLERGDSLYVALSATDLASGDARRGFLLPEPDAWGHQLRKGGEWIAYTARSQQAGEYVVFMARTVPPFEHWRASPRGGEEPVWNPAGDLVYREGNRWMSVSLPNATDARPGVARFLFTGPYLNVLGRSHDIAPDGRHLLIAGPTQVTTSTLTVVTNWVDRLPRPEPKQ
ncbi:MAG TPA: protein kinase [Gemmatimonadaceae bacterium]|nr:protein kinase [Gemmatimonadaceae bacterium]